MKQVSGGFVAAAGAAAVLVSVHSSFAARDFELQPETQLKSSNFVELLTGASWNTDGTKLVYQLPLDGSSQYAEVHVYEFDGGSDTVVTDEFDEARLDSSTTLSADGDWVLFTSRKGETGGRIALSRKRVDGTVVQHGILTADELEAGLTKGVLLKPHVGFVEDGTGVAKIKLVVQVLDDTTFKGIYVLDVGTDGIPVLPTAPATGEVVDESAMPWFDDIFFTQLSPSGDKMLITVRPSCDDSDTYLLTGLQAAAAGATSPISTLDPMVDSRVFEIEPSDRVTNAATWSNDGSLIYLADDGTGLFDQCDPFLNYPDWQFDIMVAETSAVEGGAPAATRISNPGASSYVAVSASPGGTRFLLYIVEFVGPSQVLFRLNAATWKVSDTVALGATAETLADFTLEDGSGTSLFVPAGTTIGNHGISLPGDLEISTFTPTSPEAQAELAAGQEAVIAVRDFGPDGLLFTAPSVAPEDQARLTIHYGEGEVFGLAESSLQANEFNTGSGQWDLTLVNPQQDLTANTLSAEISGFSEFAVSGEDSCGDGITDSFESCDDGNTTADDGCDQSCQAEVCYACDASEPSVCDPILACADDDGCCAPGCDRSNDSDCTVCPATPPLLVNCAAGKVLLGIKNNLTDDSKDSVKFKISYAGPLNGPDTAHEDFGNPTSTTVYSLCVYDQTAEVPSLALSVDMVPAAVGWTEKAPKGWKYKEKLGTNGGVQKVTLKPGPRLKAKAVLKAKGSALTLPPPFSPTEFFDSDPTVGALWLNSEGLCAQVSHLTPRKNEPKKYIGK